MILVTRSCSKLIVKFVSAALIMNLIRFFIVIHAIQAFILLAMVFKKSLRKTLITVIDAGLKRRIIAKR